MSNIIIVELEHIEVDIFQKAKFETFLERELTHALSKAHPCIPKISVSSMKLIILHIIGLNIIGHRLLQ